MKDNIIKLLESRDWTNILISIELMRANKYTHKQMRTILRTVWRHGHGRLKTPTLSFYNYLDLGELGIWLFVDKYSAYRANWFKKHVENSSYKEI